MVCHWRFGKGLRPLPGSRRGDDVVSKCTERIQLLAKELVEMTRVCQEMQESGQWLFPSVADRIDYTTSSRLQTPVH